MRNNLEALNNYLFEQLERVNDDELSGKALDEQLLKTKAVVNVADKIIRNAALGLQAEKLKYNTGCHLPAMIESDE